MNVKLIALIIITIIPFTSHAKIFKCKKDGKTVYKESPCLDNEKKSTFDNRSLENSISTHQRLLKTLPAKNKLHLVDSSTIKTDNRLLDISLETKRAHENIQDYQESMESELDSLQKDMLNSANNIAGATRNKQLAFQMKAIVSKYDLLIESEQKKIDRLIAERIRLKEQSKNSKKAKDKLVSDIDSSTSKFRNNNRKMEVELDIKNTKRDIEDLYEQQEIELSELRQQMESSKSNLAGATRDENLALQMESIIAKYKTKISILQHRLDRLLDEQVKL